MKIEKPNELSWSKNRPAKEGWYWIRLDGPYRVVRIKKHYDSWGKSVLWCDNEPLHGVSCLAEWAGPIQEPPLQPTHQPPADFQEAVERALNRVTEHLGTSDAGGLVHTLDPADGGRSFHFRDIAGKTVAEVWVEINDAGNPYVKTVLFV